MKAPVYLSTQHMRDWFSWKHGLVEGFVPVHCHPKAPLSPSRPFISSSTYHYAALKDVLLSPLYPGRVLVFLCICMLQLNP